MSLSIEKEKLTAELMQDPDVDWTIKGLQSLGITSADQALDKWRISVILRDKWEEELGTPAGTSSIHLFPWEEEVEAGRDDQAWFIVSFDSDGSRRFSCRRDIKGTTGYINMTSERVPKDIYPKKWHDVNSGYNNSQATVHLGSNNEVILASGHDAKRDYFSAYADRDGSVGIEKALKNMGKILGLQTQDMPGRTTFNPGLLANAILDQKIPFDIPAMIKSAHS